MASNLKGTLWLILILLALTHLTCTTVCPSGCKCSPEGSVTCAGVAFTDIPNELPVHTYLLQLTKTNVIAIDRLSLENKDLLLRFSLTSSQLHTIHPLAFYYAPQLRSLKLSYNYLSSLPARVLNPLVSLEQLHLDGNQLETITLEMFDGLVELQELNLSRNKLTSPTAGVFDQLTNLTFLNLGRNYIRKLPADIFNSLTKLRKLAIYNNEIEVLEAGMFDELVNLEELKLHHNHIASLPAQVFWPLRNLSILTLSSNRLQGVPERSFYNMPKLSQLTLYNNPLLTLPDQLMGHMPEMSTFYLYGTNLTTVPGNLFANMSRLLNLNLHLNDKLIDLPPDVFCCLPHLNKLSLKSNDLYYLHPQLFSRLTALNTLLLNDNKLQSLPEDVFQGLGQVLTIDLTKNYLKSLPGNIFLSNTHLRDLRMADNPWDCTCSIRDIARWIKQNWHLVTDRENVTCHSPPYQMLRTLGSLRDDEFDFCESRFRSDHSRRKDSLEPAQPFLTSVQTSAAASTTAPYGSLITVQGATQQVPSPTPARPDPPTTSEASATAQHDVAPSMPFYDVLVVEQSLDFVHHNHLKGWVYVWFLPSSTTLTGFLICHILLIATGFLLIPVAFFGMYRLYKTTADLKG